MEIRTRENDRVLRLELDGELDHHGARGALKAVERAIDAALPRILIFDFSAVTFMDSSGIALLLRAKQRVRLLDGTVQVEHISPQARRVLEAAGLGRVIDIR